MASALPLWVDVTVLCVCAVLCGSGVAGGGACVPPVLEMLVDLASGLASGVTRVGLTSGDGGASLGRRIKGMEVVGLTSGDGGASLGRRIK